MAGIRPLRVSSLLCETLPYRELVKLGVSGAPERLRLESRPFAGVGTPGGGAGLAALGW
jgi:hypothetical protein